MLRAKRYPRKNNENMLALSRNKSNSDSIAKGGRKSCAAGGPRRIKILTALLGFTMAFDFAVSCEIFSVYASENSCNQFARQAIALGEESHEERACALFEVPSRSGHSSLERQSFLRLQRRECILWNDQLCRAHRDLFRGRRAWTQDQDPCRLGSQRPGRSLFALRRLPSGDLRIRAGRNRLLSRSWRTTASSHHRTPS